jgi:hypothetical protein
MSKVLGIGGFYRNTDITRKSFTSKGLRLVFINVGTIDRRSRKFLLSTLDREPMYTATIPEIPYETTRTVSTRITPEIHKRLRLAAAECDATVSTLIKVAIERYIETESDQ